MLGPTRHARTRERSVSVCSIGLPMMHRIDVIGKIPSGLGGRASLMSPGRTHQTESAGGGQASDLLPLSRQNTALARQQGTMSGASHDGVFTFNCVLGRMTSLPEPKTSFSGLIGSIPKLIVPDERHSFLMQGNAVTQ